MTRLWLLLLPLALAAPRAPRKGTLIANSALRYGSYRTAIQIYQKQLAADPEAPAPNVALGKAYAKAGRCGQALDQLEAWVGSLPFGSDTATLASVCATRLGLQADALYYDRVALSLKPTSVKVLTLYALDLDAIGDVVSRDEVVGTLAGRSGDRSAFAEAAIAVRHGDADAFDSVVRRMHDEGRDARPLAVLDAQLWLDLGDPAAALDALDHAGHGASLRPLRAEAYRRLGDPGAAEQIINQRVHGTAQGQLADAVRVRILDDEGDLAGAAALLDDWAGADDADLVASRWYDARIRHDDTAMAEAERRYAALRESPLRTLDQLPPVNAGN